MAQNLFNLSQGGASESNKPLVSFRAGKCTFTNGTVTPINKKGQVQVLQTPDSLLHFQWKDRTTGTLEDDLIIFPEEAQFQKATPTSRVYLLKFTSGRKLFFWLQEPKDDKDKEYEEKINQYINNPPPPDQSAGGADDVDMATLQGLAGMNESQLRQMFQAVGRRNATSPTSHQPSVTPNLPPSVPSSTAVAPTAPVTPTVPTVPSALSAPSVPSVPSAPTVPTIPTATSATSPVPSSTPPAAASSVPSATPSPAPATTSAAARPVATNQATGQDKLQADMAATLSSFLAGFSIPQTGQPTEDVDLQEALLPELVFPLLSDDSDALKELFSHLPAGTQNLAGLRELLFSAQYGQTIEAFSHVMNSGHANSLLAMFGIDPMLAGPVGVIDVNTFISALQATLAKKVNK